MDVQTLTIGFVASQHCSGGDMPLAFCVEGPEDANAADRLDRSNPGCLTIETSQSCAMKRSEAQPPSSNPPIVVSPRYPQTNPDGRFKEHAFATHALLRKHYKYLLPWVSQLPATPVEEANAKSARIASDFRMADEFRRMSMSGFTDLSTAVYCDVRRRDEQSSPASPQPYISEPWMRNRTSREWCCVGPSISSISGLSWLSSWNKLEGWLRFGSESNGGVWLQEDDVHVSWFRTPQPIQLLSELITKAMTGKAVQAAMTLSNNQYEYFKAKWICDAPRCCYYCYLQSPIHRQPTAYIEHGRYPRWSTSISRIGSPELRLL